MPSNKDRLYVALYARGGTTKMPGGEDKYHWALLVGPKIEGSESRGKRFHAKERLSGGTQSVWEFSEQETGTASTLMILVRVQIGKIKNMSSVEAIMRSVPVKGGQPGWNCVEWVREALEALQRDGKTIGTSNLNWGAVRDTAMWYVEQKATEHRFDGKAAPDQFDASRVPTYDLLEQKELIS